MEIIEENTVNWLVLTDDGSTETKTKSSNLNQLLYGHNLFGLLQRGDEIWQSTGEDQADVKIIPGENDTYTLSVNGIELGLGEHHKTHLIDAMQKMYEKYDGDVKPLVNFFEEVRADMVRDEVLEHFVSAFGDRVSLRNDGWFINGHLLLTFEGELYHPSTDSKKRSGQTVIGEAARVQAYNISPDAPTDDINREITIDGRDYRLTENEISFLAKAMWSVKNTPDKR